MRQESKSNETEKRKEKKQMRTGKNIGAEGAKMVGESLKINTTLTKLDLYGGDDKIMKMNRKKSVSEVDNKQITILDQKELR